MAAYLSARQISEKYDYCPRTVHTLISEIRGQIGLGRYPPTSILDGCGVRVSEAAFIDYLAHRRALKDPVARNHVPEYGGE